MKSIYLQEGAAYLVPLGVQELGPRIHEGWGTVRLAGVGTLSTNPDIIEDAFTCYTLNLFF